MARSSITGAQRIQESHSGSVSFSATACAGGLTSNDLNGTILSDFSYVVVPTPFRTAKPDISVGNVLTAVRAGSRVHWRGVPIRQPTAHDPGPRASSMARAILSEVERRTVADRGRDPSAGSSPVSPSSDGASNHPSPSFGLDSGLFHVNAMESSVLFCVRWISKRERSNGSRRTPCPSLPHRGR
jgi:hypothetical protein